MCSSQVLPLLGRGVPLEGLDKGDMPMSFPYLTHSVVSPFVVFPFGLAVTYVPKRSILHTPMERRG